MKTQGVLSGVRVALMFALLNCLANWTTSRSDCSVVRYLNLSGGVSRLMVTGVDFPSGYVSHYRQTESRRIELTVSVLPHNSHAAIHVDDLLEEARRVLEPEKRTALGIGFAHIVDEDRTAGLVSGLGNPETVVERGLVIAELIKLESNKLLADSLSYAIQCRHSRRDPGAGRGEVVEVGVEAHVSEQAELALDSSVQGIGTLEERERERRE
jgi:hypothetical protein